MTDPELRKASAPGSVGLLRALREPSLQGDGLSLFRRSYRWLNLTLVHQGVWPLLLVMAGAPATTVGLTPLPWFWARLAAPFLAALFAAVYISHQGGLDGWDRERRNASARSERDRMLREQIVILFVGVAVAVSILRLIAGPQDAVLKLIAFGIADVAAYQAINFGLGSRILLSRDAWIPVVLFAVSWGLHDLFLAATSPTVENLPLVFAGGATIGLAFGALSWALRQWPGGYLAAAAAQYLFVYLVLGFLG
jgi:hypothetical protein